MRKNIFGNIIDIQKRRIYYGKIEIENSRIEAINFLGEEDRDLNYILPGLIDSHIHIESSMLPPGSFGLLAVKHGTVACVSDPHEIANVLGIKGVDYMVGEAKKSPLKIYFGAPSCVPATDFETSGAKLDYNDVKALLERDEIKYLSEMMNFPAIINNVDSVVGKVKFARGINKPVDGHAPGLEGDDLEKYIAAGISTDHECSDLEEAEEKINAGMLIQIREGSAAKNFNKLYRLIDKYPGMIMLCSDDLHPDDLMKGHMNLLVKRAIKNGMNLFNVLQAAIITPALHYNLDSCLMRKGDPADLIVIDNIEEFNIMETWINGEVVFENNKVKFSYSKPRPINNFNAQKIKISDIKLDLFPGKIKLIKASDGDLYTVGQIVDLSLTGTDSESLASMDINKIVVLNRYMKAKPAIGFINGFGMTEGAIASSIAHDSHNIIAVGTNDKYIVNAINKLIDTKGGISISDINGTKNMVLDIAGLMSSANPEFVAESYNRLNNEASLLCGKMKAPFMTLAFMALLVIPEIKIGDKGLFDVNNFMQTGLYLNQ